MPMRPYAVAIGIVFSACSSSAARPRSAVGRTDVEQVVDQAVRRARSTFPSDPAFQTGLIGGGFASLEEYRRTLRDQEMRAGAQWRLTSDGDATQSQGPDTPSHKKPAATNDSVYRKLCEPPFDSAAFARNGCILRDQGLHPERLIVRPEPPRPKP